MLLALNFRKNKKKLVDSMEELSISLFNLSLFELVSKGKYICLYLWPLGPTLSLSKFKRWSLLLIIAY